MWMVIGSLIFAMSNCQASTPAKTVDAAPSLDTVPLFAVGDARISGEHIKPTRATYYIRIRTKEGGWVGQGTLTETAKPVEVDGVAAMSREQVRMRPDWKKMIHTAVFVKKSMAPLSTQRRMDDSPQIPDGFEIAYDLNYEGEKLTGTHRTMGGEPGPAEAIDMGMAMFEGDIFGLVLAALPLEAGFQAKLPVMYSQQRTPYWVVARVVGRESFPTGQGGMVEAWAVETDWHDINTGDVFPGGGSGGTYYVVPKPPAGYPHVPKYISDSFDTEVIPQLLPPETKTSGGS